MSQNKNLLSKQSSPYLLQHADNPVHWHPWNQAALDLAKQENKAILLSIGYSACHWCHVMAHESFEDAATAELMNTYFINIKVDREERPDLDKIYQSAHSLLTSRPGGWPLTLFLSPQNQMPFFAGTYFPDTPRHNMPSFTELLKNIKQIFEQQQNDIQQQDESLAAMLKKMSGQQMDAYTTISGLPLDIARRQIESEFDEIHGGFSAAPKFPHPAIIERLLQHAELMRNQNENDHHAEHMATLSLQKMAQGGLFDHLGGGFFRYSTDKYWTIPHFEKMLYDNGPLLSLYSRAYQNTQNPLFKRAALMTADWLKREMQSNEGGYYSAQDADSEDIEGKFYAWDKKEIQTLLGNDSDFFAHCFALDQAPNFENQWHLHLPHSLEELSIEFEITQETLLNKLNHARAVLFTQRESRIKPGLDNKILTSWNAMAISGMIHASIAFKNKTYLSSAKSALDFIHHNMWQQQRLFATYALHPESKAHLNAYLDDYAYLLQALLNYLQAQWCNDYYQWSLQIADALLQHFEDKAGGGFYFTSHDHETLIQRSKTFTDEAISSGNGIASQSLHLLGLLSGDTGYLTAAENTVKAGQTHIQNQAISHCSLINTQQQLLHPTTIIILRGEKQLLQTWDSLLQQNYRSSLFSFAIPAEETLDANLSTKKPIGNICAYICSGTQCSAAIENINDFKTQIEKQTS